ncbi:CAP-Gly domain-containing protein [Trichonephila inaurata madagascariensis]|uniref:CAP-Gly domain-containing protein n=1 Tax=Trichonephila inaurata madagascariensis TaxID=2747483 RepID=A0A8X6YGL5_9ARAC|nr:CAP-Gly domain-containing protein [Trichonephila inaurata madagascariensis]
MAAVSLYEEIFVIYFLLTSSNDQPALTIATTLSRKGSALPQYGKHEVPYKSYFLSNLLKMSLERGKRRKFLLLEECYGKKITDDNRPNSLFNKSALETEVQLVPGSILQEIKSEPGSPSMCVQSLDHDNVYMLCNNSDVHELSPFEAEVLVPVSPVRDRLRVLSDEQWLKEAEMIVEGSNVNVDLGADLDPVEGIVRYCGVVPELGKGIVFGIELLVHPEHGVCDGSIKGKRYFQCASNNAIFVGINRLRLHLRGYKYTQSGNIVEHGEHREREGYLFVIVTVENILFYLPRDGLHLMGC